MLKRITLIVTTLLLIGRSYASHTSPSCSDFASSVILELANLDIQGLEIAACDGRLSCLNQKASIISMTMTGQSLSQGFLKENYSFEVKGFRGRNVNYNISVDSTDIGFCEISSIMRIR